VHAVLALTPFDTDADHLRALATSEARVLGLSEVDAAQAAMSVERVLTHDLLVRARAAEARGACRRETPVTVLLPEGTLVEGVVDLAFEEQGTWTVVDYKTDRELATDDIERYRRQVAIYMHAIATATGQPASGVILQV
jgi:ATP-dependent exoDNAse (exonuclease V) beta subunit